MDALDLTAEGRALWTAATDAGPVLDAAAKAAYRARMVELREELDEAEAFADPGRAERARAELDALTDELSGANASVCVARHTAIAVRDEARAASSLAGSSGCRR